LSGLWALGFHDLIPERVVCLTSVTPRGPRRFENSFGVFEYRNLRQDACFGYQATPYAGGTLLVAEPEKALLDHWHLSPGGWTVERLDEMRYQNVNVIDTNRITNYAARFRSPRLDRAVERWVDHTRQQDQGMVTLRLATTAPFLSQRRPSRKDWSFVRTIVASSAPLVTSSRSPNMT
jgi:hypothetical protein